jgi:hypothetical protein
LLLAELWRDGLDMTRVLRNKVTNAANKNISATARVQEHTEVPLLREVRNVASDAREVPRVVLKQNAADGSATVEYGLVLGAGTVCEGVRVLEAPLKLIAESMYSVLDIERLLDE